MGMMPQRYFDIYTSKMMMHNIVDVVVVFRPPSCVTQSQIIDLFNMSYMTYLDGKYENQCQNGQFNHLKHDLIS